MRCLTRDTGNRREDVTPSIHTLITAYLPAFALTLLSTWKVFVLNLEGIHPQPALDNATNYCLTTWQEQDGQSNRGRSLAVQEKKSHGKKASNHAKMLEGKLDGMMPIKPGAIRAVPPSRDEKALMNEGLQKHISSQPRYCVWVNVPRNVFSTLVDTGCAHCEW
ncbi:hypothetical protein BDP81DRAFT_423388 [Colletotrichum phormii]|uniref:Uncharacterized protein n=1 Tax=Colletotrichum phormii TaxID=359342 RepID=A0AAI9ZWC1_9PEZI|nr:uncharacterized protein BDP81DRAFT_423388 [Colletotrichum phormii]KAK1639081.1 hypothetical protein BDP81DRAFT_423388 [Colletotrichum phormii]